MSDFSSYKWRIKINRTLFGIEYTHDKIKKILSGLHLDYWCMSDEWCQQNYYTVIFIYGSKPIKKSILSLFFPIAYLCAVDGSCKYNRMFVWKEGIFKKKFPRVISLRKTREQWHPRNIGLSYVLHNT